MIRADTLTPPTATAPPVAHTFHACWERAGVLPVPSLCGQVSAPTTPPHPFWRDGVARCVVCEALENADARCPHCRKEDR